MSAVFLVGCLPMYYLKQEAAASCPAPPGPAAARPRARARRRRGRVFVVLLCADHEPLLPLLRLVRRAATVPSLTMTSPITLPCSSSGTCHFVAIMNRFFLLFG